MQNGTTETVKKIVENLNAATLSTDDVGKPDLCIVIRLLRTAIGGAQLDSILIHATRICYKIVF